MSSEIPYVFQFLHCQSFKSYVLHSDNHISLEVFYIQFYKKITLSKNMWIKEIENASI